MNMLVVIILFVVIVGFGCWFGFQLLLQNGRMLVRLEALEAQISQLRTAPSAAARAGLTAAGFNLAPGEHPIIPVMLGDAALAQQMAAKLLDEGVYVIGFSYPVVPMGKARIRTQMSSALSTADLDHALAAFARVGRELGVIS